VSSLSSLGEDPFADTETLKILLMQKIKFEVEPIASVLPSTFLKCIQASIIKHEVLIRVITVVSSLVEKLYLPSIHRTYDGISELFSRTARSIILSWTALENLQERRYEDSFHDREITSDVEQHVLFREVETKRVNNSTTDLTSPSSVGSSIRRISRIYIKAYICL
jgi:hypothetical protein